LTLYQFWRNFFHALIHNWRCVSSAPRASANPWTCPEFRGRDVTVVVYVLDVHVVMDEGHGVKRQVLCWFTEPDLCCFP
jgi:hypothetical protein